MPFSANHMQTSVLADLGLLGGNDAVVISADPRHHITQLHDSRIFAGSFLTSAADAIFQFQNAEAAIAPEVHQFPGNGAQCLIGVRGQLTGIQATDSASFTRGFGRC